MDSKSTDKKSSVELDAPQPANAETAPARREYRKPELKGLGMLEDLTEGSVGPLSDGGTAASHAL